MRATFVRSMAKSIEASTSWLAAFHAHPLASQESSSAPTMNVISSPRQCDLCERRDLVP